MKKLLIASTLAFGLVSGLAACDSDSVSTSVTKGTSGADRTTGAPEDPADKGAGKAEARPTTKAKAAPGSTDKIGPNGSPARKTSAGDEEPGAPATE